MTRLSLHAEACENELIVLKLATRKGAACTWQEVPLLLWLNATRVPRAARAPILQARITGSSWLLETACRVWPRYAIVLIGRQEDTKLGRHGAFRKHKLAYCIEDLMLRDILRVFFPSQASTRASVPADLPFLRPDAGQIDVNRPPVNMLSHHVS